MILIALGSNVSGHMGTPLKTIHWAIGEMTNYQFSVKSISSFYRTKAVGQQGQADYVNGVVCVRTAMSAENILKNLKLIEQSAGRDAHQRRTSGHWGPRSLDLDIIDYKGVVSQNFQSCSRDKRVTKGAKRRRCHLILPHPEAHLRPFVIRPIIDIAPFWHHPVNGLSAQAMWIKLRHSAQGQILHKME